jgi:TolA-binding protein
MGGQDDQEQKILGLERRIRELEALVSGMSAEMVRLNAQNENLVRENDKYHLQFHPRPNKKKHGRR